jgi:hypothetical protein
MQGMCHPARLSWTRVHPVPWFPYRIWSRSPLLLCNWKEQWCRIRKLSVLTITKLTPTFPLTPQLKWRYTLFFGHFASELSLLFSPSPSSHEYQGYSILSVLFPTRLPFQHIRLLHQVCYFVIYRFQSTYLTVLFLQLFMFFSIAVSRVAPVLFPDASDDASSVLLAQSAAVILEKVKTVDRERTSRTTLFVFHTLTCVVQNMVEMQMLSMKPMGSKRSDDPDEHTLELLTREMEHLVIENRLASVPSMSDLGRARSTVIKRVKAQAQERPRLRRRTLSHRSTGSGQLPSPVSPPLKPQGISGEVEVIDVDALPEEGSQPKQWPVIRMEQESLRSETGPILATCIRARSKSC